METNKEQPTSEVSNQVSAENCVGGLSDTTSGSLNKFKDVKSLEEAYVNLQSEFTRKCQRLSELEKDNSKIQNLDPFYEKAEWKQSVSSFLERNPNAQKYAGEIMDVLINDKVLASATNSLDLAYNKVLASKYKSEDELLNDEGFIANYILNNENIKKTIINNYLDEIKKNKSPQLINSTKTGSLGVTPNKKPSSLSEAMAMAEKLFKQ